MYFFFYNIGIRLYGLGIHIAALFNAKAHKWVKGRSHWREDIIDTIPAVGRTLWVHAASLGEMEQGLPILRKLKEQYPEHQILVTFFSPSGLEHFENEGLADYVLYLPLDTRRNAQEFLTLISPELALFIKYDLWLNFFKQIELMEIPLVVAPAAFREDQWLFKNPGRHLALPLLKKVDQILVQNEISLKLLQEHGFENVQLCGDTRFEQAMKVAEMHFISDKIQAFCEDYFIIIGGSTWPREEDLLEQVQKRYPECRLIIAPHDVSPANIQRLQRKFNAQNAILYSEKPQESYRNNWVMIIDSIGLLKKLYRHGHMAFIGGGFGKSVHSTIEPVVYKIPVAFGPNRHKFPETEEMIQQGIGFEIRQASDLEKLVRDMDLHPSNREKVEQQAERYLQTKKGGADMILSSIKPLIIS